ncbi:ferritin [Helicovermis profundi]|uniref:Ferritin n=1 Tax=Helicovermis profundi TaxID=3065157 RepID=A0AAU9EMP0_9FIRM|nr:ferritin [Clostridia bacterium S502]
MINKKLEEAFNKQINAEFYSAYLYLSMAAYLSKENFEGFASWMKVQFEEEQFHAFKMYDYLLERGGEVKLELIEKPQTEWNGIIDVFDATLKHERHVSALINKLADVADEVKDRASLSYLQWFIDEQVEEESNAETILKQLEFVEGKGHGVLMLDRELGSRVFTPPTTV